MTALRTLPAFLKHNSGATSVIFALSTIPIVTTLGISVDVARAYSSKASLQSAADAAALAAAISFKADKNTTNASLAATNTFAAAKGAWTATLDTPLVDSATGKVSITARTTQSNFFIPLISPSKKTTNITAVAEVTSAAPAAGGLGMNLEVALMLDVTVSMSQNSGTPNLTKLAAMQQAAKSLIDTVVQTSQTPYKSRVALVPFSSAVNVGTRYKSMTGSNPTSSWTSVVERGGGYAFTEDAPSALSYFGSFRTKKNNALGSAGSYTQNLSSNVPATALVMPLSSDKTTLKNAITAYTTAGSTAGHLGTAFSWYALSPSWAGIWGAGNAPDPYDAKTTMKVAVLMSDFDFNTYYLSANGNSASQTATLCSNMKTAGITVYTIGFQVNSSDSVATGLFTNCASTAANRLSASNGAQMIAAFDTIAKAVVEKASGAATLYVSK